MEHELMRVIDALFNLESVRLMFAIALFFAVYKGIPWAVRTWRGEIKKDKAERNSTRDMVHNINMMLQSKVLPVLDQQTALLAEHARHLAAINGSFRAHCDNSDIHTPKKDIINDQVLLMRYNEGKRDRRETKAVIDRIFAILDGLKGLPEVGV